MKEYNFKEYVKRKMENISDVLNIVKKSVNELKENANHLPKSNEVKLASSQPIKTFYGEMEIIEGDYYYDNLIWNRTFNGWVETSSSIYHMEWDVTGRKEVTYESPYYMYDSEYLVILYFDENENNLGYQIHYGDNATRLKLTLTLPEGTTKIHSFSNDSYVQHNAIKVIIETEKPREDLYGSLDKTIYSFILKKPNTESINPFYESINYLSLDYIDIKGEKKTIEITPIVEIDKYNDMFKKITHDYYDNKTDSQYSFEINNYGYDEKEYNHYVGTNVNVKITCKTFVESEINAMLSDGNEGEFYTFYCEVVGIRINYLQIDNKINTNLVENIDFNKMTNLPSNIEKQIEYDSVVMKLEDLTNLYKDISNFDINDVSTMNHCPEIFESTATSNVITDDNYYLIGKRGISILNLYENEVGGRGVKFTIPSKRSASVWVEWQPTLLAELYNEEGELLDINYENRDNSYANQTYYCKNIFEIKNLEDTDVTYYIIFKSNSNYVYYNRVFDVKVLLRDEIKIESANLTSEDILNVFMEMDLIQPIADENNNLFIDEDGKIFIL